MSAPNNVAYRAAAQVAITQASLATGSSRESAVVDNTTDLDLDKLIQLTFTLASGALVSTGPYINIYAAGCGEDELFPIVPLSTNAPFQTGAGDASVGALASAAPLRLIGSFGLLSTSSNGERTFRTQPMSVAAAFGGALPPKFSIIVENQTGVAFSSSASSTAHNYMSQTGITTTSGS